MSPKVYGHRYITFARYCNKLKYIIHCLRLGYEHVYCCHGNGNSGVHVCKVSLSYTLLLPSYKLE